MVGEITYKREHDNIMKPNLLIEGNLEAITNLV
jgi:hypothetical protein